MGWGIPAQPADTSESEAEWFHSISTLLTLPRNSGKPIEETTLHRSFTDAGAPTHVDNPDAREAIIQWVEARQPSTETTCDGPGPGPGNDAGPGNGPDPGGDCVLPTKAESEARFILLDLGTIYDTCKTCHAGGSHSHAGTGDDWGTPEGAFNDNPSATAWHDAVWALTEPERHGVTVEESTLYHYVAGIPSGHFKYQQELDATVPWLDFVINGDESTGCP